MINAFARNGMGSDAIDLYRHMPEVMHDTVTHICDLNACSHAGLVDQARQIFEKINDKTEKIITTMIACLCRMFVFDEAQKLIDDCEKSHPPSLIMYTAMLSAARTRRAVILSEQLYDRMKSLFPAHKSDLITASILLANTYSSVGDEQRAFEVRLSQVKQLGKSVQYGLSWTELNGELLQFKAHDRSHPRSTEIYAKWEQLSAEIKAHGHEFDPSSITRPLNEGESIESVLCGHSEKLAIAFHLIQPVKPRSIQITKNLRVCIDCHGATKIIAELYQCEIIVRDANRIHHFYPNGQCSCQDQF